MEIKGYKAFNEDFTNRYNRVFKEEKSYHTDGEISFGLNGKGFHFCKRLEDTLRYFDTFENSIVIAEVIGSGKIVEYHDDYYEYYDLYASSDIKIVKFLSREEIIDMALKFSERRMKRFIMGYKLKPYEIYLFEHKYPSIDTAIDYYQRGNKEAYLTKKLKK